METSAWLNNLWLPIKCACFSSSASVGLYLLSLTSVQLKHDQGQWIDQAVLQLHSWLTLSLPALPLCCLAMVTLGNHEGQHHITPPSPLFSCKLLASSSNQFVAIISRHRGFHCLYEQWVTSESSVSYGAYSPQMVPRLQIRVNWIACLFHKL